MKNKNIVVTLENCTICKSLKEKLKDSGIQFLEIPCEKSPEVCDELESLTGTTRYPMIIIKNYTLNKDTVYFMTNDYIQLGKEEIIDSRVSKIGVFSSEDLLNIILNLK